MNRHRSHWLAIALLVATCLAGVILAMVTLGSVDAPASGDLAASSLWPAGFTLFLMGVLLLVGTKILRTRSLHARARHASHSASTTPTGATVRI
jgi:uncharacterized membrane protein YhaH (DUF805 family)